MTLLTLDEARTEVSSSAIAVLDDASCDLTTRVYLVWGSGALDGLSEADNRLAQHHRAVLDNLIDLGYEREAVDEIEGCCSAAGLGDEAYLDAFPVDSPEAHLD